MAAFHLWPIPAELASSFNTSVVATVCVTACQSKSSKLSTVMCSKVQSAECSTGEDGSVRKSMVKCSRVRKSKEEIGKVQNSTEEHPRFRVSKLNE